MRSAKKKTCRTFSTDFFDWRIQSKKSEDPVEKVEFFDWIRQSESASRNSQSKKVESKKPFFDCLSKLDLGFSRKRPFSTDKYDCISMAIWTSVEK